MAMQRRWHDPQPIAMVQHGGRIKLRESPSVPTDTAPPQPAEREPGRAEPSGMDTHGGRLPENR
jgi:hypothetical protein